MNTSSVRPSRKSLAETIQYERVAIFEAVLTLRDKRIQNRTKAVCWSIVTALALAVLVGCSL